MDVEFGEVLTSLHSIEQVINVGYEFERLVFRSGPVEISPNRTKPHTAVYRSRQKRRSSRADLLGWIKPLSRRAENYHWTSSILVLASRNSLRDGGLKPGFKPDLMIDFPLSASAA